PWSPPLSFEPRRAKNAPLRDVSPRSVYTSQFRPIPAALPPQRALPNRSSRRPSRCPWSFGLACRRKPARRIFEGAQTGDQSVLQFHEVDPFDQPVIVGGIGEHRTVLEAVRASTNEARLHIDFESWKG